MFISDTQARTARTGSFRRRARVEKRGQWRPISLVKFDSLSIFRLPERLSTDCCKCASNTRERVGLGGTGPE